MGTTVFKSIMAENFASFAERIKFTCIADESKKEHQLNTFKAGDETINKVSYVYGANGSKNDSIISVIYDEKFSDKGNASE